MNKYINTSEKNNFSKIITWNSDDVDFCLNELEINGVKYEKRAMPYKPLPFLMSSDSYNNLKDTFFRLTNILEKVITLYLGQKEVSDFFNLPDKYDKVIRINPGYEKKIKYCHFDFTFDNSGIIKIYELNAACPAGQTFSYYFSDVFKKTNIYRDLSKKFSFIPLPIEEKNYFTLPIIREVLSQQSL